MTRIARVVAPGIPHHITQRGNRKPETFSYEEDYKVYTNLRAELCDRGKVDVWGYCRMPHHIQMMVVAGYSRMG